MWSGCWADVTIRYCEIKSEHKYIIEYLGNKMDLKALMQTLETIDKKQNLMESEKKETTWTDKSGKKHPATQVKGDKYTGKEAEKDAKKKEVDESLFTSGIAQALLREFGLEEAPVANPYQGADAAKFASMSPADQAWLTKGGKQPDINDPYILMRAPNKGKQVTTSAHTGVGNPGEQPVQPTTAPATTPTTAPTTGQAAQPSQDPAKPVTVPAGINPETGEKYDDGTSAPLQLPPGAEPEAGMTVAGDKSKPAEKKPASGIAAGLKNPGTMAIQDYLNKKYGTNLKVDGQAGNATQTAISNLKGKVDSEEFKKIAGLGYAYNVKPGQGPGTISLGNPEFNKMMSDLGYDPKTGAPGAGAAAQPAAGGKGPTVAAAQGQSPGNPLNQKPGQAAQPAPTAPAPTRGGSTPVAKQQPKATQPAAAPAAGGQAAQPAGKVDLSVNNPAMNPANNAPLPTPGTASGSQLSPQQIQAQKDIARAREKVGKVAPDGNGSGTLVGGQVARESVRNEDDAILQRIRNALHR